ncbi:MAG: response regulator [Rhodospirillales bacterium]|nr:response regulator [Rhodospirillales bacterium]
MDQPTLAVTTAIAIAFFGLLLLVARGQGGVRDPLTLWGSALLCGALGLVLLAARTTPWLTHAAANVAILTGTGLGWTGCRLFMERPALPLRVAVGPLLWLALDQVPALSAGHPGAIVTASLIGATYTTASAVTLARPSPERLPSRAAALVMLAFHILVFLGRGTLALLAMIGARAPAGIGLTNVLIIEGLLHTAGMSFILLAMTKDRAEARNAAALIAARDAARSVADAKSRFLARMSHEVRTPLNGILGLAQVLVQDPRLAADQREWAETLERAGRHLLSIVNDALDLAKVEAGRMEIAIAPLAPGELGREALALLAGVAEAEGVRLILDLHPALPGMVAGDAIRLRQVLLNLLSNAVRLTPKGGEVRLVIAPHSGSGVDMLRFAVTDTGPGVPAARRGELFKDFAATGPVGRDGSQGSGLGLAISAALVRAMSGRIGFTPGPEDRGAIFWMEVPLPALPGRPPVPADPMPPAAVLPNPALANPAPTGSSAAQPAAAGGAVASRVALHPVTPAAGPECRPTGPLCVLVADDVASNRKMAQAMLEQAGHATRTVEGGEAAITAVAAGGIDVVLMDMRMPDLDGMEATRRIRALDGPAARVKIVALSADAMPEHILACEQAGMDGHVAKPVERARLLAEIARVTNA